MAGHFTKISLVICIVLFETLVSTHAQGLDRFDVIGLDPCIDGVTCDILPANIRYPVPGDCASYYICSQQGELSIEDCPNGQLFHYPQLTCSKRANPRCLPECDSGTGASGDPDNQHSNATIPIITATTVAVPRNTWGRLPDFTTPWTPGQSVPPPSSPTSSLLSTLQPGSLSTTTTSATTTRPTDPAARCAPYRDACVPGERFGYIYDCRRYYVCQEAGDDEQYWRLETCWSNQGFDVHARRCMSMRNAQCENSCPGFVRVETTSSTTRTTEGITTSVTTAMVEDINTSAAINNPGVTSQMVPSSTTNNIMHVANTTLSAVASSSLTSTAPILTTTTPRLVQDPVDCAPPEEICATGEQFGYAYDCNEFYLCTGSTGDGENYYEMRQCWSTQGFDIYVRDCVDIQKATCETSCPGYVRTTPTVPPTVSNNTTTSVPHSTTQAQSTTVGIDQTTADSATTSIRTTEGLESTHDNIEQTTLDSLTTISHTTVAIPSTEDDIKEMTSDGLTTIIDTTVAIPSTEDDIKKTTLDGLTTSIASTEAAPSTEGGIKQTTLDGFTSSVATTEAIPSTEDYIKQTTLDSETSEKIETTPETQSTVGEDIKTTLLLDEQTSMPQSTMGPTTQAFTTASYTTQVQDTTILDVTTESHFTEMPTAQITTVRGESSTVPKIATTAEPTLSTVSNDEHTSESDLVTVGLTTAVDDATSSAYFGDESSVTMTTQRYTTSVTSDAPVHTTVVEDSHSTLVHTTESNIGSTGSVHKLTTDPSDVGSTTSYLLQTSSTIPDFDFTTFHFYTTEEEDATTQSDPSIAISSSPSATQSQPATTVPSTTSATEPTTASSSAAEGPSTAAMEHTTIDEDEYPQSTDSYSSLPPSTESDIVSTTIMVSSGGDADETTVMILEGTTFMTEEETTEASETTEALETTEASETTQPPDVTSESIIGPTTVGRQSTMDMTVEVVEPTTRDVSDVESTAAPEVETTVKPDVTTKQMTTQNPDTGLETTANMQSTSVPGSTMLRQTSDAITTEVPDTTIAMESSPTTAIMTTSFPPETSTDSTLTTTSPPFSFPPSISTPCNRQEPCFPGRLLADPEDCSRYYECGLSEQWLNKSCGDQEFDVVSNKCMDNGKCAEPCVDATVSTEPGIPTTASPELTNPTTASAQQTKPTTADPGEIVNHQLSLSDDKLAGEEFSAQCSFTFEPPRTDFSVTWFLNDTVLHPGERVSIVDRVLPTHTSTLTFDPLRAEDTGTLSCYVRLEHSGVDSTESSAFSVLALPASHLDPMTATLVRGEALNLTCAASLQQTGHPHQDVPPSIHWYSNGSLFVPADADLVETPGESVLTVSPSYNTQYACAGYNPGVQQDEGPQSSAAVTVVAAGDPVCAETEIQGVTWSVTAAGGVSVQDCPDGKIGNATCPCGADGEWGEPNFLNCVNQEFVEIANQIERLEEGIGGVEEAEEITESLEEITNTTSALPPGDINSAVDSVATLAEFRRQGRNVEEAALSEQEMESVTATVSNLLTVQNDDSWDNILQEYPDKAVSLLETVDTYGGVFAQQMQQNDQDLISTDMLVVQVDTLSGENTQDLTYPNTENWEGEDDIHDSIMIRKETLNNIVLNQGFESEKLSVSSSYYKTMELLLPTYANYTDESVSIGSRVLALSVNGVRGMKLAPPIEMTFSHTKVPKDHVAECGFWNYSANGWSTEGCTVTHSNDSLTACHCDHLTNFAVLVSKKPVEGKHAQVLSIISIVGCVISIAGLLLTILVYISIWKHVKSHHAVVLINLCIALLLANLLFVTGVDKTSNEALCTAIAALLHYFYLAAFFVMLVEGIQLVLYIIYVFHVRRKRETATMLFLAWFAPAVIVGMCLGISQTDGYGTEDYCWLDYNHWVFWMFIVPILIIILINVGILIAVLKRISGSKLHQVDKNRNQRIRSGMWNIVVIMPILGITWLFGIFSVNSGVVAFQYIFAICNSLQGLFIFIFHAVCNKKVRDALTHSLPSSTAPSSSGFMSHLPGKKGNYSMKTTSKASQRTQRSRLKSDTSSKPTKKAKNKDKKDRKQSSENPYDTIPADYDMDTPPKGQLAVENEYMDPDEVKYPSCFDPYIAPDAHNGKALFADERQADRHQQNGGVDNSKRRIDFENDGFRKDSKYKPKPKADLDEDNYMMPQSQQHLSVGFTNPTFSDDYVECDRIALTLSDTNKTAGAYQNTLSLPRQNGVPQKRLPRTNFDSLPPKSSSSLERDIPPPYSQFTPPHSLHPSLQRGASLADSTLSHKDSSSSLQRGVLDKLRRVDEMKSTEVVDVNLRKSESPLPTPKSSPRPTPKSSPFLPRSTPFLAKASSQKS